MISTAVLFSTSSLPVPGAAFDLDAVTGLAEWRQSTPMLFKLLVGAGTRRCSWPVYGDGEDHDCVLAAPLDQAQASWQRLCALMAPPRDAAAIVARSAISTLLATARDWLVLDCVQLIEHDIATPDYAAALQAMQAEAQQLHAALLDGDTALLAPLLGAAAASSPAIGYWSASASAHLADVEELDSDTLPFLQGLEVVQWHESALCYEITRQGQAQPVGLVTPYGRWIVPLALGVASINAWEAGDGWLTVDLPAAAGGTDADAAPHYGVMDVNGIMVLPPVPAERYALNARLLLQIEADGTGRLLQLPGGVLLMDRVEHIGKRDDGYLDFQRQSSDADERNTCGVMDQHGRIVLQPEYSSVQDFGTRKKIAIVSQHIDGRYLFGLANAEGKLLAPCQYSEIDCAHTSAPPRVRKKLIYAVDAAGLACMLTTDGRQAFVPYCQPAHHLRGVVVQDEFLHVCKDGMAWRMDFAGRLLEQLGTIEQFRRDISAQLSAAMGLDRAAPPAGPQLHGYTPAQLLESVDTEQLQTIAAMLVLGDTELAERCVQLTLEELAEDDPDQEYEGATPEAACLFALWSTAAHALGFGTTLDWKAVDEIAHIGAHITVPALQDFRWPGREDGEGMEDGLHAIGRHLDGHGLQLVNVMSGDDTYYLGLLRDQDVAAFERIAEGTGREPQRY